MFSSLVRSSTPRISRPEAGTSVSLALPSVRELEGYPSRRATIENGTQN